MIAVAGNYIHQAAPTESRPGAAPPPPQLLIGRDDVLREIKARLTAAHDHTQVLTTLKGRPSVGKTTVAAALAGLLRGQRRLLMVDDVWQAEHARPFCAGGPGCALLATTRHADVARALAPQAVYTLPVLTEAESLALLRELAPGVMANCEPACRKLARALDGLPLALQVAGRLLQAEAQAGLGVDDLLARLREGARLLEQIAPPDRADVETQTTPTVAALLRTSTDYVDDAARAAFANLCAFPPKPVTFDLAAFEAVCMAHAKPPRTPSNPKENRGGLGRDSIRALVDRGLMEAAGAGRWQLHALLTAHAAALLDEPGRRAACLRHAQHYAEVIGKANQLLLQGGKSFAEGLALFDVERANIFAGQAWAAAHTEQDAQAAQHCNWYAWQGSLLTLRLHPREYTRWLEAALTAARKMGNREAEGAHLGNLGLAYAALGETRRAIELYEQRLVIAREIGDRRGEGADLGNLGSAHFTLKDYPRAVEYYNEQRVIAQEIGDRRGVGNAFWGQAICFEAGHDLPQAIAHAEAALAIFVAIESPSAQTMRDMLARWRGKDATDKSG